MFPGLEAPRMIHESVRRMIDRMVGDVIAETRRQIAAAAPETAGDIRRLDHAVAVFSPDMRGHDLGLKRFLFQRMYRHPRVNLMTDRARRVVADLFARHIDDPGLLPADWRIAADGPGGQQTARLAADYIAGMTDKFALEIHSRIGGGAISI